MISNFLKLKVEINVTKSWRMTVLAAVRLMPSPPAFVDNINMNISLSLLNWSIKYCLKKMQNFEFRSLALIESSLTVPERVLIRPIWDNCGRVHEGIVPLCLEPL